MEGTLKEGGKDEGGKEEVGKETFTRPLRCSMEKDPKKGGR